MEKYAMPKARIMGEWDKKKDGEGEEERLCRG